MYIYLHTSLNIDTYVYVYKHIYPIASGSLPINVPTFILCVRIKYAKFWSLKFRVHYSPKTCVTVKIAIKCLRTRSAAVRYWRDFSLSAFARLLDAFKGTYEGTLQHYLGCEVTRDMDKGTTYLSQTHNAEEIPRTYNFWNATPRVTPMQPNTRLNKDDCDKNPAPDFHQRYRGVVGSLGYLVTMTRPDLARAHSELSKLCAISRKESHACCRTRFVLSSQHLKSKNSLFSWFSRKPQLFVGLGRCILGLRHWHPPIPHGIYSHDEWWTHFLEKSTTRQRVSFYFRGWICRSQPCRSRSDLPTWNVNRFWIFSN